MRVKDVAPKHPWMKDKIRPKMLVRTVNEQDVSELKLDDLTAFIRSASRCTHAVPETELTHSHRPLRCSFLLEDSTARTHPSGNTEAQVIVDACQSQVASSGTSGV